MSLRDISTLPVHAMSATWVASVNANRTMLHADTGSNPDYGIPFVNKRPNETMVKAGPPYRYG